jgi:hypothetical protein
MVRNCQSKRAAIGLFAKASWPRVKETYSQVGDVFGLRWQVWDSDPARDTALD